MPRGRKSTKNLGHDEAIAHIDAQIESHKDKIAKLKKQKEELIEQYEMTELNDLLKTSGKSIAEIKELLQGK